MRSIPLAVAIAAALTAGSVASLVTSALIPTNPIPTWSTSTVRVETRIAYRYITEVPTRTPTLAPTATRQPLVPTPVPTQSFSSDRPAIGKVDTR